MSKLNRLNKYTRILLICISYAFISFISIAILLHTHSLYGTDDMWFHLKRLMELKLDISHGNLFPEFSFNQFHGSAIMLYYPYINIYPLILLSYVIKSKITLVYLFFCLNTFISLIICFFSSWYYNHTLYISYLFSIVYSLSAPFITYYYGNMDLGICTTLSFLPLIIFGYISLFTTHNKKWLMFPIGLSLIVYSNILSIFIVISLVFIWTLLNTLKIDKKFIIKMIYSGLLVVLLTAIEWVPAVYFSLNNVNNIHPPHISPLHGIKFSTIINYSVCNHPNFYLGIAELIAVLGGFFCYKKFTTFEKQMFLISVFFIIMCSNIIPWPLITSLGIFKILGIFQFLSRFYIIPQLLLSYLFSVSLFKLLNVTYFCKILIIIIVIILIILLQFILQGSFINNSSSEKSISDNFINKYRTVSYENHSIIKNNKIKNVFIKNNYIKPKYAARPGYIFPEYKLNNSKQVRLLCNSNLFATGRTDYYPMNSLIKENYVNNNKAYINNSNKSLLLKHTGFNEFILHNVYGKHNVELPILRYNGEHIHLYINGHLCKWHTNKYNLIDTKMNKGTKTIYVKYIPNSILYLCKFLIFIIGLLMLTIFIKSKRYINRNNKDR